MTKDSRIPTNLRNLLLIETVAKVDRAMLPIEISRAVGLSRPTVHRLCRNLINEGFLVRTADGKRLGPGRRLRRIATGILHESWTSFVRRQVLVEVARRVGETVNFVVPGKTGMRYVDRVETDWPVRVQLPVGTEVPFHCTASGKVYLASLTPARRQIIIDILNLKEFTPNTLVDHGSLFEDTVAVGEHGYALDKEEFIVGMNAIAVPVKDDRHRYVASLAIHGPKQRLTIESAISQVKSLLWGADALRTALFLADDADQIQPESIAHRDK